MLVPALFLLLKYAQSKCDVSCDCSDDRSSISYCSDSRESDCRDDFFRKIHQEGRRHKLLTEVPSFVSINGRCPSFKSCKPHLEFANIAVFLSRIPNMKKLGKLYKKDDIRALARLAAQSDGMDHYDALNAFYYNADSHSGIRDLRFDSNFILFFLQRFLYFLDILADNKSVKICNRSLTCMSTNRVYDILSPPCTYTNLTFDTDSRAMELFNSIIGNTAIHETVSGFIRILLHLVKDAVCRCNDQQKKLETFTTYSLYADLLQDYLKRSEEIVVSNTRYVEEFGTTNQTAFFFIWFPFAGVIPPSTAPAQAILFLVPTTPYTNATAFDYLNSEN